MLKDKKILAIIPARGGSKGLPRKNIKNLAGKPLIAWTIESALKSRYLDRVIVSTEDKEIAKIARRYGAEVIERPKKLATDKAETIKVIFHVLRSLKKENYTPEIIILLQPTSPLRSMNDVDKAIEYFLKNGCESVVSVYEFEHSPYWTFEIKKRYLTPIFGWKYFKIRRQDLPKIYIPNGAIFIADVEILEKYKSFYTHKTLPYIMPVERSVDIDNEIDFKLAELILQNKK